MKRNQGGFKVFKNTLEMEKNGDSEFVVNKF